MVGRRGFEPTVSWLRTRSPDRLEERPSRWRYRDRGIRTHTERGLSSLPLPLGYVPVNRIDGQGGRNRTYDFSAPNGARYQLRHALNGLGGWIRTTDFSFNRRALFGPLSYPQTLVQAKGLEPSCPKALVPKTSASAFRHACSISLAREGARGQAISAEGPWAEYGAGRGSSVKGSCDIEL